MPQKYIRHFLTNEVLAKLLLASPFFRRGTEGVVSFNCNKLIIKKLLNPLNPPLPKVGALRRKRGKQRAAIFLILQVPLTLNFF
jgi:hypothetical protein